MISPSKSLRLAYTKLRHRKLLTVIAVVISSLLFAILFVITNLSSSAQTSLNQFIKQSWSSQFLVHASPVLPHEIFGIPRTNLPENLKYELLAFEAKYIENLTQIHTQIGLEFNPNIIPPIIIPDPLTPSDFIVNFDSPAYQPFISQTRQTFANSTTNTIENLHSLAKSNGATKFHNILSATGSSLSFLPNGYENLSELISPTSRQFEIISSAQDSNYLFIDQSLVDRFILPSNFRRKQNQDAIPVLLTITESLEIFSEKLDLPDRPKTPTAQLDWIQDLKEQINGLNFSACYRNSASVAQIHQAINQQETDNLILALPTEPCGAVKIMEDDRTEIELIRSQKLTELAKNLGTHQEPENQKLTFVIIGLIPDPPQNHTQTENLNSFITDTFTPNWNSGAIIPIQLFEQLSSHAEITKKLNNRSEDILHQMGISTQIIAFNDVESAQNFIKNHGCHPHTLPSDCPHNFFLETFGMNYILLNEITQTTELIMKITIIIIAILATIVITFTTSRLVLESRQETAVFRALGAKRSDISTIYLTHNLLLALVTFLVALTVSLTVLLIIHIAFAQSLTAQTRLAFGFFDVTTSPTISFINIHPLTLLPIFILIITCSLLATIPPLLRNLRRSPLAGMRE